MPPLVLLADPAIDAAAFRAALEPDFACVEAAGGENPGDVVCLVTSSAPVGLEAVAPFPRLRLVVTCSVGTDHLDVAGFAERGIAVANCPTYCTEEVADHALACVLAGWRGLGGLSASVRSGTWDYAAAGPLRRLDTSRLALVGYGRIGRAVARRALALGVDVVAHDPLLEGADVPLLPLEEALRTADAVSLHVPGGPMVLGAAAVAAMKPGAVLVNVSRPGLADLDAVLAALRTGHLGCAYWDVWPEEPPAAGDPRLETPGLHVTPHAAWYSTESEAANIDEAVAAIRRALTLD